MGICRMEVARIQAETSRGALLTGAGGGGCSQPAPPKTARPGGPVSVLRTTRSLLQHKVAGVGQRRDDLCLERALAGAGRRPSELHGDPGRSRAAA